MSAPFLWVHGGMNLVGSITLSRILPGSLASCLPPDAKSPFQVSWARLAGLLHSLLIFSVGGEIFSFYPATHLQDPFLWRLNWATCSCFREGWAGFISAKWNPVFLPEALIYGAMLGRAVCGLSFSFFKRTSWYSLNSSWQLAAK